MKNADKFKEFFGIYASEVWAKSEREFLEWLNEDVPEKNVGKWIFGFDEETGERDLKAWTCSLCGEKYPWQPNFCPNCGADMRERREDEID